MKHTLCLKKVPTLKLSVTLSNLNQFSKFLHSMRQVLGFGNRSTGRGTFGGEFGAHHCNQWGLYGVRVRQVPQPSELRFGVVRAVGRRIAVLHGVVQREGEVLGFFVLHFHNGKCHWVSDGEFSKSKRHYNGPMLTISSKNWQKESR